MDALASGCYRETAYRAAGIGATTFARWMEQGEADDEADRDSVFRDLRMAIMEAEARAEQDALGLIQQAARDGTWQAAAWFLERKKPERWGRRERHQVDSTVQVSAEIEVVHNRVVEITPDEAQRREIARILGRSLDVMDADVVD